MSGTRKLYRRPKEGKVFGVVAGLAEYFDVDVTLLRVIVVVLVVAGAGFIIPLYLLLALLLPTNEAEAREGISVASVQSSFNELSQEVKQSDVGNRAQHYLGIALIVVGSWIFFGRLFPEIFTFTWALFWPAVLVLAGVLLLFKKRGEK